MEDQAPNQMVTAPKRQRYRRVRGTGRFAQALSCVVCGFMFAAVSGGVFGGDGMPQTSEWLLWLIVATVFTCIIIRSFMIGVWVGAHRTRVRGWFLSVRFENKEFRRVSSVGYSGLLNEGNMDGSAKTLKALLVQIRRDSVVQQYYFAGLIALRGSAARQVRAIDMALDRPVDRK